jgi:transposase-like protein
MSISAIRSTRPRVATAATRATAPGRRRCWPRSAKSSSTCRATATGSFEPPIVKKRQRRLAGVDELVISLAAKGLTTGEIAAHLADVYGAKVSKDTISRITQAVMEELQAWQSRPLDSVYPVVFIDAIHVKIRDGKVVNRPVYTVVGVTVNGERNILASGAATAARERSTGTRSSRRP